MGVMPSICSFRIHLLSQLEGVHVAEGHQQVKAACMHMLVSAPAPPGVGLSKATSAQGDGSRKTQQASSQQSLKHT
jgi:hypothetical protein